MNNMEIKVSVKDIPEVIEQLEKADKKINDLQQRIDEAIEYINNLNNKPNIFEHYGIDGDCKKWLLKILGDKEC